VGKNGITFQNNVTAAAKGGPEALFSDWGGPQRFLESYADHIAAHNSSLFAQIGPMDGERKPQKIDVTSDDGRFCWFFHYHDAAEKSAQMGGHFHLFADATYFNTASQRTDKTHLIAIELDQTGDLAGFFAPNRWTTDEYIRPSSALAPALDAFFAQNDSPDVLLPFWLSALLKIFKDDILKLLLERDKYLDAMSLAERELYLENTSVSRICEWRL
jgi:hypothetical protein